MKKLVLLVLASIALVGCGNQTLFDTTYTFKYAEVKLPNGSVKSGAVKEWKDYDDATVQVKFEDGTVLYTHSSNVILSVGDYNVR